MTLLASINLNKRFNSRPMRARFERWLAHNRVQVLFAQEPWKRQESFGLNFTDFASVGGNERVFTWMDARLELPPHELVERFWQRVELGYLVVYNVYLDAYDQAARASQLEQLRQGLTNEGDRPVLIVGDFNIAPHPTEGLFGGEVSSFNSEVDRGALHRLVESGHLIDLGNSIGPPQWTIERQLKGRKVQFRCDLAFASDYVAPALRLYYDHSVRSDKEAFTDHSALLIDVSVTIHEAQRQFMLLPCGPTSSLPATTFNCKPEKTAIHRKKPTTIARKLMPLIRNNPQIISVLDYGCGYGEDVRLYRTMGLQAEGYDPHPPFGWSRKPTGEFDLVTVIFVLNVLSDPWTRLRVLREAARYLSRHGLMVVATRSTEAIRREAERKGWPLLNDGYWSHAGRGTFQRGLCQDEILIIAKRVGLVLSQHNERIDAPPGTTCVILQLSDK